MSIPAHTALIALANELGYTKSEDGLCHGTTLRYLEASLLGQQDKFIARIEAIKDTPNLKALILDVKNKVKRHENLTEDDLKVLDILAFYDSLMLYQDSLEHSAVFNRPLSPRHMADVSLIAGSEEIREQGGLATIFTETNSFTLLELDAYLKAFLASIATDAQSKDCNISVTLSSHNHTMGLSYQKESQTWVFMDINQWPPLEISKEDGPELIFSVQKLTDKIRRGFLSGEYTTCTLNVLTTQNKENELTELKEELGELSAKFPVTRALSKNREDINQLLFVAAQHGNFEVVQALLEEGADPNLVNINGVTPLYIAAQNGHIKIVEALLEKGGDFNPTGFGWTPLFKAAQHGHLKIVQALLEKGADHNQVSDEGLTPLFIAAVNGRVEIVATLLETKGSVDQSRHEFLTPLSSAALNGHIEVVEAFLKNGVDANQASNYGVTPLYAAAQNGHIQVMQALLEKDGDPNLASNDGLTPLFMAAQNGHIKAVQTLLEKGAAPNLASKDDLTPLYMAAANGHLEIVTDLLGSGADPNLASKDGLTPLYMAAANGHLEIVTDLLGNGADPNLASIDGVAPLFIAAQRGHHEIVTVLLSKGANPNQQMHDGATPLYTALLCGHHDIAKQLLSDERLAVQPELISASQTGYAELVEAALCNQEIRAYYLEQILLKPRLMRNLLLKNEIFLKALSYHRLALWQQLQTSVAEKMPTELLQTQLQETLKSKVIVNPTEQHPLYLLLHGKLEREPEVSILDDIENYLNASQQDIERQRQEKTIKNEEEDNNDEIEEPLNVAKESPFDVMSKELSNLRDRNKTSSVSYFQYTFRKGNQDFSMLSISKQEDGRALALDLLKIEEKKVKKYIGNNPFQALDLSEESIAVISDCQQLLESTQTLCEVVNNKFFPNTWKDIARIKVDEKKESSIRFYEPTNLEQAPIKDWLNDIIDKNPTLGISLIEGELKIPSDKISEVTSVLSKVAEADLKDAPPVNPAKFKKQSQLRENMQSLRNPPATVVGTSLPDSRHSSSKSPTAVISVQASPSTTKPKLKTVVPISSEITLENLQKSPLNNLGNYHHTPLRAEDIKEGFTYSFADPSTTKELLSGKIQADGSGDVIVAKDNAAFINSSDFAKNLVNHLAVDLGWNYMEFSNKGPNALSEEQIKAVITELQNLENFSDLEIKIGEQDIEDYATEHFPNLRPN